MTTERDADYANLQRTIAELQVENERLAKENHELRGALSEIREEQRGAAIERDLNT